MNCWPYCSQHALSNACLHRCKLKRVSPDQLCFVGPCTTSSGSTFANLLHKCLQRCHKAPLVRPSSCCAPPNPHLLLGLWHSCSLEQCGQGVVHAQQAQQRHCNRSHLLTMFPSSPSFGRTCGLFHEPTLAILQGPSCG